MIDYEKLGVFYLGKRYDPAGGRAQSELILYDSKDLTTHGVCVGMTGSGKTGLCIALLEEAAIDGIPIIAIDPKGDLCNLALTFPELKSADFRPWIDTAEAARNGMDPDQYAGKTAELWKNGLLEWGQDGTRISRLRQAARVSIYTPGSNAGLPLSLLRSFTAPPSEVVRDTEFLQSRITSTVEGLLALVGIQGDRLRSREHILLANIFNYFWGQGKSLDLPGLIRAIQTPPFDKLGVFDLESFYATQQRFELAMQVNNLLASPGFSGWLEGDPLDIQGLLYGPQGEPRIAVVSIAHLSDAERMFFVTMLLSEMLTWVRNQAGTSSLRAILYMDEIFGYFPPTANPPTKKPMLTLLKQARAFGLGILLATQNPVDLDYKGLSNTGTWFIGRLQTERDKLRVLDGLQGASLSSGAAFDRGRMEVILAGLGSRVFLMHNVHDEEPVVFQTRWTMSYLRGPLGRNEITALMEPQKMPKADLAAGVAHPQSGLLASATQTQAAPPDGVTERPVVPASIDEFFVALKQPVGDRHKLLYRPAVVANVKVHYVSNAAQLDYWRNLVVVASLPEAQGDVVWEDAAWYADEQLEFEKDPPPKAAFAELSAAATYVKNYEVWKKDLTNYLYQNRWLTLYRSTELSVFSNPGEDEGAFRGRIRHMAREQRDIEVEKLKKSYARKFAGLQDRIRRAEQRIEREQEQYQQQKLQATISIGSTLLGALLGRKATSYRNIGRATTAMRGVGRAASQRGDITRAQEELNAQLQKLEQLEAEFKEAVKAFEVAFDPLALQLEEVQIRPKKSDIVQREFGLGWTPWRITPDAASEPLSM